MADRLAELLRQRALLADHLAWLDGEIAASRAATASANPTTGAPDAPVTAAPDMASTPRRPIPSPTYSAPSASTAPSAPATPDVDRLLDEYRVQPDALRQDVRKGCFLYFAGAFLALGIVVVILYFGMRSD